MRPVEIPETALLVVATSGAHPGRLRGIASCARALNLLRSWYQPAWWHELLRETRTYLRRTRTLLKERTVLLVDLGFEVGADGDGHSIPCTRTRGRIRDTQYFVDAATDRTCTELSIFLRGWDAGAMWVADNPHSCIRDTNGKYPCMKPPRMERWKRKV